MKLQKATLFALLSVLELARDDALNMAFFRSQGMMGGPFIQLEMGLA